MRYFSRKKIQMLNQLRGVRSVQERNKAMKKQLEWIAKKANRETEKAHRLRERSKERGHFTEALNRGFAIIPKRGQSYPRRGR